MPTTIAGTFLLYICLFGAYVLVIFATAFFEKWGFKWQVLAQPDAPKKFLDLWRNLSFWGDLLIVNQVMAIVLARHAKSWSLEAFITIFVVIAIVGIGYLWPLLQDSLQHKSAWFRDGMSPLSGTLHQIYWTCGMSVCLSYFILTPRDEIRWWEVVLITIALMIHWVASTVQPPYVVHGEVHLPAKIGAAAGVIMIPLLALYLLVLA
ncbi:hypothetical protein A2763_01035 [Candidatus Kaiserbacteria bacterium RIFCSPHIGHO2_01_FULL_54_36]|uniref:Uncharacterized protein n=1 Tax=Candidatus Kaiserbacteria bacterium RIFCSPHIGHO2_01_FULL_54_36 TaxID=1798482 RepID=A0A1F6CM71_9BACT|nr:MAG: hypothetical protein A2763_01035 [Candidatus Kaiserbacteria bacterium RIFCSPHIGHO2_01_FULL_54_36]OGG75796.1 MAG: hypothetical protein A3A41_04095 [Candidatus Kaiserbacteria bacterium RIFCSPLOWO2_01_FULL_54_22]